MTKPKKEKATRVKRVDFEGTLAWEYSDGSIRMEGGQYLKQPPYPAFQEQKIVTSEQGREMQAVQTEQKKQALIDGLAVGLGVEGNKDAGVLHAIGIKAGQLLKGTEAARGFAELGRFAVEKSGLLPKEEETPKPQEVRHTYAIDPATARLLAEIREARNALGKAPEVVDGQVTAFRPEGEPDAKS